MKTFRDLTIAGDPNALRDVLAALETSLAEGWQRDGASEANLQPLRRGAQSDAYCFACTAQEGRRAAKLWLVATTLVTAEWQDRVAEVEKELESHIREIDRAIADLHIAADFASPGHTLQRHEYATLNIPSLLRKTAQAIVDHSHVLAEDEACMIRARMRRCLMNCNHGELAPKRSVGRW
jgi:hypothetical protein